MSSASLSSSPSACTTVFRHSGPFPASNLTSGEAFVTMDRLARSRSRRPPPFSDSRPLRKLVLDFDPVWSGIGHYELHSWVTHAQSRSISCSTPQASVSKLLGSLKAATAKRANLLLQRSGQPFWQDESYDHLDSRRVMSSSASNDTSKATR